MTKTLSHRLLFVLATLLLFFSCAGEKKSAPETAVPSSVILISIDTLRWDRFDSDSLMPNLKEASSKGTLFTNAYCSIPSTAPSHGTMLTGLRPPTMGLLSNEMTLMMDKTTLAEILSGQGWNTAAFPSSKVLDPICGLDQGFDLYDAYTDFISSPLDESVNVKPGFRNAEDTTRLALAWLKENASDPFFLWVHYYDPHMPYWPPDEYAQKAGANPPADYSVYQRMKDGEFRIQQLFFEYRKLIKPADLMQAGRLYNGESLYTDYCVGELLSGLEQLGAREKTLIVVTADHGESLGEHGLAFCHLSTHEQEMHVPLLFMGPAVPEGKQQEGLVELVDLFPTVLDVLGIESLKVDGQSLAPCFKGEPAKTGPMLAFGEDGCGLYSMRDQKWCLIADADKKHIELYSRLEDPLEMQNVADGNAGVVNMMHSTLTQKYLGLVPSAMAIPYSQDRQQLLRSLGYTR